MWTLLICIALAAATFVAFEGVKNNGFVLPGRGDL
jgi:hypothetical protein